MGNPSGLTSVGAETHPFLETLVAALPGFVCWKNTQCEYLGCNLNLAKLLNLEQPSDIIGLTDEDLLWTPEEATQFTKDDLYVIAREARNLSEHSLSIKREDGRNLHIRMEKTPLYDDAGQIVGVVAVSTDITEEKIARDKAQSEHLFVEDILYDMPGLVYWKDKQSRYRGFNKNVVTLSGLTRESLRGKTDKDLNWGRAEAESFIQDDRQVMETGVTQITQYTIPIKRPDGSLMTVRTEKSRLLDRGGNIVGVLGVAMDITDQEQVKRQLSLEKEQLKVAQAAKTDFIRNMQHDFRTPFSGIWGLADCLFQQETDNDKKEMLHDISASAKQLLEYCNQIVDFSNIQAGESSFVARPFELTKLVDEVIMVGRPAATVKNLSLSVHYKSIPDILIGDEFKIRGILINLVGNAIKFTKTGEVTLALEKVKQRGQQFIVDIIVSDTGIGIPKEKQQHIYESFAKLSLSNQEIYPGLGVGLSIVKKFMHDMNGDIQVESAPNEGSRFTCTLAFKLPLKSTVGEEI